MTISLLQLWMPILLGTFLAWIASALIHIVVKYHNSDYQALSNEEEVMDAVRNGSPKLGIHTLPYCAEMSEMNQPEVQEKFNKGPVAILTVFPNGLPNMGKLMPQAVKLMKGLYRCFRDKDAQLVEINPLAVIDGEKLMALDAKMGFDGNAMFRRADIADLRDFDEEDPKEVEASGHGLNYIALDGNVGCIVNGAGLAMATMDAITLHGGTPANFLDVGGGASPEKIANAFRIVLEDPNVKTILLNIFAGINRCDWVATGIVQAIRNQHIEVPVVVRLAGTNVEEGRRIMEESGLDYIDAENLNDAAIKAVRALGGR